MKPDQAVLEGMARSLLAQSLDTINAPLAAAIHEALVALAVECMKLGMRLEQHRPPGTGDLPPALRSALVREDSLDAWCAHSSSDGAACALADTREKCRTELIEQRIRDDEGVAAAIASVDHALDHGDTFITRCAVRVAWVNDGEEHQPTPAWLDTVPE